MEEEAESSFSGSNQGHSKLAGVGVQSELMSGRAGRIKGQLFIASPRGAARAFLWVSMLTVCE